MCERERDIARDRLRDRGGERERAKVCMCVCVRARAREPLCFGAAACRAGSLRCLSVWKGRHTLTRNVCVYVCVCMCACACACVCVRERV